MDGGISLIVKSNQEATKIFDKVIANLKLRIKLVADF